MKQRGHIVFAWELGGGYGHISAFMPVARILKERGYRISWILRDLSNFWSLSDDCDDQILQAPFCIPRRYKLRPINNYSDLLYRHGFQKSGELISYVKGWKSLYKLLQPDLLVCDHSPTAILAARGLDFPVASFGNGFLIPPEQSPMPSLKPRERIPEKMLQKSDEHIIAIINKVMHYFKQGKLNQVSDLFDIDESFLCTFPELDHYEQRNSDCYWGPRMDTDSGEAPSWPESSGPKVFAYLRKDFSASELALNALGKLGWPGLVHFTGTDVDDQWDHSADTIHISSSRLNMSQVCQQADIIICHAGHGTVSAALMAGKSLLLFPTQQEQGILSHRLTQFGLGLMGSTQAGESGIEQQLQKMANNPAMKEKCELFARKYQDFDDCEQTELIADRCAELIQQG